MESGFGTAIEHPGPAPDITAGVTPPKLSTRARWALRWRACHGPLAFLPALAPAAIAFGPERPWIARLLLLAAAVAIFLLARWALGRTMNVETFAAREQECRRLWQAALAQWETEAGSRRFDAKHAELEKLQAWWATAALSQRERIGAAIHRASDELWQIANRIEVARASLRQGGADAHARLLQARLDLETVSRRR
jgi:hypothetical protein